MKTEKKQVPLNDEIFRHKEAAAINSALAKLGFKAYNSYSPQWNNEIVADWVSPVAMKWEQTSPLFDNTHEYSRVHVRRSKENGEVSLRFTYADHVDGGVVSVNFNSGNSQGETMIADFIAQVKSFMDLTKKVFNPINPPLAELHKV